MNAMDVVTTQDVRAFVAARDAARSASVDALRERLEASLPELTRLLVAAGAQRVLVFGSLVSGDLHERSDIDLAVAGLPPQRYFATLAQLLACAPVAVDLVELESAPASLAAHILETGREVVGPTAEL